MVDKPASFLEGEKKIRVGETPIHCKSKMELTNVGI